jgi:phosphate transport system protein
MAELGWKDRDQAYQALRVVLHALRDRLPEEALAAIAAQLPLLIRGIYYEGWDPSGKPLNEPEKEDFLAQIAAAFRNNPEVDPERVAWAVFKVLKRYATSGAIRDMEHILPPEIRALWPESEEAHAHKHVMSNATGGEAPSMRRPRADLERLTLPLNELTARIEKAVRHAIQALIERRPKAELAEVAVHVNDAIDSEEGRIEEECLRLLAGSEPVTDDLRKVAAVLKINTHLEVIADLAVKIADLAMMQAGASREVPIPERLRVMTCSALRMIHDSIDAFIRSDSNLARTISTSDEVHRLNREITEDLKAMIRADPDRLEAGFHLFSVAQHLVRIAGHATNIAEYVVYLREGEIVRHRFEPLS